MIYYNRDFYCVQIHDAEVACDGILFNNLSNIPVIGLSATDKIMITYIFKAIEEEFKVIKAQREEMLRVYLETDYHTVYKIMEYAASGQST